LFLLRLPDDDDEENVTVAFSGRASAPAENTVPC